MFNMKTKGKMSALFVFKNLIKIGLKQEYLDNEELRNFFKRVFCLALILIPSVDAECIELRDEYSQSST